MEPRTYLRLEAATILLGLIATYFGYLNGSLWIFVVFILTPDIGMLGYLHSPTTGSITYNVFHVYSGPLILGVIGLSTPLPYALELAVIWATHIALDRTVGYGLKHTTGFKHTHLSTQPTLGNLTT